MELRLLGAVECWVDGRKVPLGRPQARCVLAVLLLERGRVVPLSRLIELLWDVPPPRAPAVVQTHISRLRTALRAAGADQFGIRLVTHGSGYAMEAPDDAVDLYRFRGLVQQVRDEPDPARRAAGLRQALALWRGPVLADVATSPLREQVVSALEELPLTVAEQWAEAELEAGRHRDVLPDLAGLVGRHPLHERLVELLMLAQYRSGQQAAALTTYRRTRTLLVTDLGVEPGHDLRSLEQAILAHDPALRAGGSTRLTETSRRWRGPRSSLTSIVGRSNEQAELVSLLAGHRLVTVVGPGGVGKTSLALHVAETVSTAGRAVVVIPLAPAAGGDDAILALAAAMEVQGASVGELLAGCGERLAAQPTLLVLDNCEHLTDLVAGIVRRLLAAAPRLIVLATSREPLGLPEEMAWRLGPLGTPPADAPTADDAPAVSLFLRRAGEADPGFVATRENLEAVGRIARRVDGLPLALELAARRLRSFPAAELADHLDHSMGLLTTDQPGVDPRHSTVTATIDWSYRLLTDSEQRLLTRLSVFRDGFTVAAAATVCGAPPLHPDQVPQLMAALVDRSLVQPIGSQPIRYQLLEVVRSYAARRLSDEAVEEFSSRHLDHWLEHARTAATSRDTADQVVGLRALLPELDNLRAAVDHAYASERVVDAVELTALLADSWIVEGSRYAEADRWLVRAEHHLGDCPPRLRGLIRMDRGLLRNGLDDCRTAHRLLTAAGPDLAGVEPEHTEARIIAVRCAVRLLRGDFLASAKDLFGEVSARGDTHVVLHAVAMLAEALVARGQHQEAAELCRRHESQAVVALPTDAARLFAASCMAELGAGDHGAADSAAHRLRLALDAPGNFLIRTLPSRVLAQHALTTKSPGEARAHLATVVRDLENRPSPIASPSYVVRMMLAEAERLAGYPDTALATLRRGLSVALTRSDYAASYIGIVGAALLASDLGDEPTALHLAAGWRRASERLGIPYPLGYGSSPLFDHRSDRADSDTCDSPDDDVPQLLQHAHDWAATIDGPG